MELLVVIGKSSIGGWWELLYTVIKRQGVYGWTGSKWVEVAAVMDLY